MRYRFVFLCLLCFNWPIDRAYGDWTNPSGAEVAPNIAEITILSDRVLVTLEVYVGNGDVFADLIKRDNDISQSVALPFRILADNGTALEEKVISVVKRKRKNRYSPFAGKINPISGQPFPAPPKDDRVYLVEIEYLFRDKPDNLTIVPPVNSDGRVAANIGFITYHNSVAVTDFRFLSGPATIVLNWHDPWYSRFDNNNLSRHHRYPLMIFLYVDPRSARLDILARIRDLAEWTGVPGGNSHILNRLQQQTLKNDVRRFFQKQNILNIDGKQQKIISVKVDFLKLTQSGLTVANDNEFIDIPSTFLGISQSFAYQGLPQKIIGTWTLFNDRVDKIPVMLTDPAGPFADYVMKDSASFSWQNFLRTYVAPVIQPVILKTGLTLDVPLLGEVQFYSQPPTKIQATEILSGLISNLQVAYLEKQPEVRREELRNTVMQDRIDGNLTELDRAFAIKVNSGGTASTKGITKISVDNIYSSNSGRDVNIVASWEAFAVARHWGHADLRRLRFQASIELRETDQGWKMSEFTLVDIKRLDQ